MTEKSANLVVLPCLDSDEMAELRRQELDISRDAATTLGRTAVEAARKGRYTNRSGNQIDLRHLVDTARSSKISIAPDDPLPTSGHHNFDEMRIQVANDTTLMASQRLLESGLKPLALNFANGVNPGGGFLQQTTGRSALSISALFVTLADDPMYESHRKRPEPDSTDWAILSPDVPVFRNDDGTELDQPWLLSFLTCAAPYAPGVGQSLAGDLLQKRIHRVLAIARAYEYHSLVLGAWGCGAFKNDPRRTAADFRTALETKFSGVFSDIVFAVTDWSPERRFLGPFRDVFSS